VNFDVVELFKAMPKETRADFFSPKPTKSPKITEE